MLPDLQFVCVVWGASYTRFFIEACLPSLFASQNIPCIYHEQKIKFRLYSSTDDRETIINSEIYQFVNQNFQNIEWVIDTILVDNALANPQTLNYQQSDKLSNNYVDNNYYRKIMNDCLSHSIEAVIRNNNAWSQIFPDAVYANGSISSIYKKALTGKKIIWVPPSYRTYGISLLSLIKEKYKRDGVITIEPRELVKISLDYMLPNMRKLFWGNFDRTVFHWGVFWKDNTQIIHRGYCMGVLFFLPENKNVKFNYQGLSIEGTDFWDRAVPNPEDVYYIDNSDEYFTVDLENMEISVPEPLIFSQKRLLIPSIIELALIGKNYIEGDHARNTFKADVRYQWNDSSNLSKEQKIAYSITKKVFMVIDLFQKYPILESIACYIRKIETYILYLYSRFSR